MSLYDDFDEGSEPQMYEDDLETFERNQVAMDISLGEGREFEVDGVSESDPDERDDEGGLTDDVDPDESEDEGGVAGDFDDEGPRFARPGSALRAASRSNPRDQPCPTCRQPNLLTRQDVALGYQCDGCADEAEGHGP